MTKYICIIIFLILNCCNIFSQNNEWLPSRDLWLKGKLSKVDENIRYTLDSLITIDERNQIILKTKQYISQNLSLINESEVDDSIHILLIRDRYEMFNYFKDRSAGKCFLKGESAPGNIIVCIYGTKYTSLSFELMQMITALKWGQKKEDDLEWLNKGLATLAAKGTEDSDSHTFEERYVYFLQNNKLLDTDRLLCFSEEGDILQNKIICNQSAYIVECLYRNYGIKKIKKLWIGGMEDFEKIYGLKFEKIIQDINNRLKTKYRKPIDFNWENFAKDSYASQNNDWLPSTNPFMKGMLSKECENIRYTIDSTTSVAERNHIVAKAKEYISQYLALINESEFDDLAHIVVFRSNYQMNNSFEHKVANMFMPKDDDHSSENMVTCIYGEKHGTLGHELAHMINFFKWGQPGEGLVWLSEGLAVFFDPSTENCDGYTFEERYVYLLQNDKLIDLNTLIEFQDDMLNYNIAYNQSAYIVGLLLENYGIEKIKLIWTAGMEGFEKIYGLKLEDLVLKINNELNKKYPDPIDFNWEKFNKKCVE